MPRGKSSGPVYLECLWCKNVNAKNKKWKDGIIEVRNFGEGSRQHVTLYLPGDSTSSRPTKGTALDSGYLPKLGDDEYMLEQPRD